MREILNDKLIKILVLCSIAVDLRDAMSGEFISIASNPTPDAAIVKPLGEPPMLGG